MAPRKRPPKRGLGRMDAALDAMKVFGFPESLIVKTVKDLLNVYGDDGWPFIEEACYKVLLDTILENVENEEQQKKDNSSQDAERGESSTMIPICGPLTRDLEPTCSHVEDMDVGLLNNEALDSASQSNGALDGKNLLPPAEGEGSGCKDMDQDSGRKQKNEVAETGDEDSRGAQPAGNHPPRRRRPYYGWICSDDEEDLVELTPGPLSIELAKFLWTDLPRKRKSRWDVRPEDM